MRWRWAVLLSVLAVAVLGGAPPAGACSCAVSSDEELFAWAGAAFIGRVVGVEEGERIETAPARDALVWTFAVSEVYKGEVRRTQQVVSPADSAGCGLSLLPDRSYLVFTDGDPAPWGTGSTTGQLTASLCDGTRSGSDGSLSSAIASPRAPLADAEPSTPAPEPPPPARPGAATRFPVLLGVAPLVAVAVAVVLRSRR